MWTGKARISSIWSVVPLAALAVIGCERPVTVDSAPPIEAAPEVPLAEWRRQRDESLRRSDGWLSLVGLHWLEEGDNSFGSDPANDIEMPASAPSRMGVLRRTGRSVELLVTPEAEIFHDEEPVEERRLVSDLSGTPTLLTAGTLTFHLIERGEWVGIRVKDSASPLLAEFVGMEHFPADPGWRIEARFEPYDPPKQIEVPNILGTVTVETAPGVVVFELGGDEMRLEPTGEPENGLFLVFGDRTNGHETYGGGRFLQLSPPIGGRVVIDFNRAYNPPCVFTPFATCPLPPPQNRLPVPISGGEKMFAGAVH